MLRGVYEITYFDKKQSYFVLMKLFTKFHQHKLINKVFFLFSIRLTWTRFWTFAAKITTYTKLFLCKLMYLNNIKLNKKFYQKKIFNKWDINILLFSIRLTLGALKYNVLCISQQLLRVQKNFKILNCAVFLADFNGGIRNLNF